MSTEELDIGFRAIIESQKDFGKWQQFIACMLNAVELDADEFQMAKNEYETLANRLSKALSVGNDEIAILPQGSMCTQTTVSPHSNRKFDLDIVVKICSNRLARLEANAFFETFGKALGKCYGEKDDPERKRRCWRLGYPNKPFYFDVTPAIPDSLEIVGTDLRVYDPETTWSPSNPEEFRDWFCNIASKKMLLLTKEGRAFDAAASVEPIPDAPIGYDDILRRTVQLVKLNRDFRYSRQTPTKKEGMPISVIIVTLLGHAYDSIVTEGNSKYINSPVRVILESIRRMPYFIRMQNKQYLIANPVLPDENFAEKWNQDNLLRAKEFMSWHGELLTDFTRLFSLDFAAVKYSNISDIFGERAAEVWDANYGSASLHESFLKKVNGETLMPTKPTPMGSKSTLA